ncbi:protein of unknown function nitrogen fixation [Rippkaea orientalis PCC 8801]|uniref:Nif11 domain-containing protein n=1 Tax=Rippkaea orientalis (strain PCC 8801 / RF-1) TaxID=41431 RepID=B7K5F7_RIPO1|nr:Nif11-like leader peptide family natural product precursor [Rippkaea orientalis]ACK66690.1 protein of unknown function nitrogen fixation [Rippkaea orientalis PCC 8801]
MSLVDVKSFYQRLAKDEAFRTQLQEVTSKEECSQLVQASGYNFTQEEFESYTSELLESSLNEGDLQDLNEKELEAVFGGASSRIGRGKIQPLYGVIWPPEYVQPLYGVVISE